MDSICSVSPMECSAVKKNHYIIINKRPCKIVDVAHSKTGKHGHLKVVLTGIDVLTGRKYNWMGAGHLSVMQFNLVKNEYSLIVIEDSQITCLDSEGKEVIFRLSDTLDIYKKLCQEMEEGKSLIVSVVVAPVEAGEGVFTDETMVDSFKEEKEWKFIY